MGVPQPSSSSCVPVNKRMDDSLFDDFVAPQAAEQQLASSPASSARPAQPIVAPPAGPAPAAAVASANEDGSSVPPPRASGFGHLHSECIASVNFHGIDDVTRSQLEQVLRDAVLAPAKRQKLAEPTCGVAPAGVVHFFQAFCADYAGASSAAAAAITAAQPQYERLLSEPLPLARLQAKAIGGGRTVAGGRGAGRSGGRGGGNGAGRVASSLTAFNGRYYDAEPTVRPGALSAELRALLGMREGDPPPYLRRMQQLGYPPGYLGDPSARGETLLELIDDEAPPAAAPAAEAGGRTDEARAASGGMSSHLHSQLPIGSSGSSAALRPAPRRHVPLVDFPGVNVPPPPDAHLPSWNWLGPVRPR